MLSHRLVVHPGTYFGAMTLGRWTGAKRPSQTASVTLDAARLHSPSADQLAAYSVDKDNVLLNQGKAPSNRDYSPNRRETRLSTGMVKNKVS